jgi:hypothetical protein
MFQRLCNAAVTRLKNERIPDSKDTRTTVVDCRVALFLNAAAVTSG